VLTRSAGKDAPAGILRGRYFCRICGNFTNLRIKKADEKDLAGQFKD